MIANSQSKQQQKAQPYTEPRASRSRKWFLWIFSIVMVLTAGTAFIFKLIEFSMTFWEEETNRTIMMPLLTYLIVASGFSCLFVWAILTGQFKDVEQAKYRMLEMQDEIDYAEQQGA